VICFGEGFFKQEFKFHVMEDLFSTNIAVNNKNVNYHVIFDNEKYVFFPEADNKSFPSFSFKREHDQWLDHELLHSDIKKQAVEALDNYLLRQH
jgi:hypothetical protein